MAFSLYTPKVPTAAELNTILKGTPQATTSYAVDSTGSPLPNSFSSYPETVNESNPSAITVTRSGAGGTYVQTITKTGDMTSISQWVRQ